MSEIKVNKITPRAACGTTQLGDSGDTFTIPSGATITNAGTASGFGATGETSWDTTVKTTGTFTATAGVGYFLNTTGGIITVNLPAGAAGSSVAMVDYAGTWQTNNVTVTPNGSEKIGGINGDGTLSTEGQSVTFVYIDGTQGWVNVLDSTSNVRGNAFISATVSGACNTLATAPDCADVKIATFLGPGTFCVSAAALCAANNVVSYMVVAGGGAGGGSEGGGGGAGGFREYESPVTPYTSSPLDGNPGGTEITVSATPYPIGIGGGAATQTCGNTASGTNSTFSTIISAGGGGGSVNPTAGLDGGSGGGGARDGSSPGGTGNTPVVSPPQGKDGGTSPPAGWTGGGGGGGATTCGTAGSGGTPGSETAGNGGAGATTSISATPTVYAGGGGGSAAGQAPGGTGVGGSGGGGDGAIQYNPPQSGARAPTSGSINTGGGGGGGYAIPSMPWSTSGGGGSGIVIIRYKFQ